LIRKIKPRIGKSNGNKRQLGDSGDGLLGNSLGIKRGKHVSQKLARKIGFYCYIFCETFKKFEVLAAACTIFITQMALLTATLTLVANSSFG
jgi:hypothetical protein